MRYAVNNGRLPSSRLGYAAIARGTLAAAATLGSKGAASSYQAWKAKTHL